MKPPMNADRRRLDGIVELKAVKSLDEVHKAQRLNYLKATGLKACLLVNSGRPKLKVKRIANKS